MYRIAENFDINCFNNIEIIQIAFGLNSITLHHDKGYIQFSGGFSIKFDDKYYIYNEVYPVSNDFGLINLLLEKKVTNVKTNDERTSLTLEFDKKIILVLLGNDQYESFRLNYDGNEIIV